MPENLGVQSELIHLKKRLESSSPENPDFEALEGISLLAKRARDSIRNIAGSEYKVAVDFLESLDRDDAIASTAFRFCFSGETSSSSEYRLKLLQNQARFSKEYRNLQIVLEILNQGEIDEDEATVLYNKVWQLHYHSYIPPEIYQRVNDSAISKYFDDPIPTLESKIKHLGIIKLESPTDVDLFIDLGDLMDAISRNPHSSLPPELENEYNKSVSAFVERSLATEQFGLQDGIEDLVVLEAKSRGIAVPEYLNQRYLLRLEELIEDSLDRLSYIEDDPELDPYVALDCFNRKSFLQLVRMLKVEDSPESKKTIKKVEEYLPEVLDFILSLYSKLYLGANRSKECREAVENYQLLKEQIKECKKYGLKIPDGIEEEVDSCLKKVKKSSLKFMDLDRNKFLYEIISEEILAGRIEKRNDRKRFINGLLEHLSYSESDENIENYIHLLAELGVSKEDERIFDALHREENEMIGDLYNSLDEHVSKMISNVRRLVGELEDRDFPVPEELSSMMVDFQELAEKYELEINLDDEE